MPLLKPEPKYTRTDGHVALIELLGDLDFIVEEEVSFPPYTVDCYIEKLHLAVEFDGPQHSQAHDMKRDKYLFAQYALPVVRVSSYNKDKMLRELCWASMSSWSDSANIRRGMIQEY